MCQKLVEPPLVATMWSSCFLLDFFSFLLCSGATLAQSSLQHSVQSFSGSFMHSSVKVPLQQWVSARLRRARWLDQCSTLVLSLVSCPVVSVLPCWGSSFWCTIQFKLNFICWTDRPTVVSMCPGSVATKQALITFVFDGWYEVFVLIGGLVFAKCGAFHLVWSVLMV